MSDWWAKKLRGEQPQPALAPSPVPHQPVYPVRPEPVTAAPATPQHPSSDEVSELLTTTEGTRALLNLQRGGQATREERNACPNCGGSLFSRSQVLLGPTFGVDNQPGPSSAIVNSEGKTVAPAPICTDCGWNGLWQQSYSPRPSRK